MLREGGVGIDIRSRVEANPDAYPPSVVAAVKANADATTYSTGGGAMMALAGVVEPVTEQSVLGAFPIRVSVNQPVLIATRIAASTVSEGAAKGIASFTADPAVQERAKVAAQVVLSLEFARVRGAVAVVERQLVAGLVRGVNAEVANLLLGHAQTMSASGSDAAAVLADLAGAAALVGAGASSELVLVVAPEVAPRLALMSANGAPAFADMSANGIGSIQGIRAFVADSLSGSPATALVVDVSRVAIAADETTLRASRHGNVAMSDDGTGQPSYNLWQRNSIAEIAERLFSLSLESTTGSSPVAAIDGAW